MSPRTEFWLHAFPVPLRTAAQAAEAEAQGYDGMLVADSAMLVADPYLELLLAARETERLRLGPGVTNPVTRHPVVTAAAIATLQIESGGRAVLVMGGGNSAVLQLGLRPATTSALDTALTVLQDCLGGRSRTVSDGLATRMGWIDRYEMPKVPVSVAASGPATIALGARHGGRIDFTVGADLDRIAWAVDEARRTCPDPEALSLGAFINVAVNPDRTVARNLVRGSAAIFVHFVSEGPLDALPARDRAVVAGLGASYAEARHGLQAAAHATALPDDFLDRFTVAGTPDDCTRRLRELTELGLDRIIVVPGSRDADPQLLAASNRPPDLAAYAGAEPDTVVWLDGGSVAETSRHSGAVLVQPLQAVAGVEVTRRGRGGRCPSRVWARRTCSWPAPPRRRRRSR